MAVAALRAEIAHFVSRTAISRPRVLITRLSRPLADANDDPKILPEEEEEKILWEMHLARKRRGENRFWRTVATLAGVDVVRGGEGEVKMPRSFKSKEPRVGTVLRHGV